MKKLTIIALSVLAAKVAHADNVSWQGVNPLDCIEQNTAPFFSEISPHADISKAERTAGKISPLRYGKVDVQSSTVFQMIVIFVQTFVKSIFSFSWR